MTLTQADLDALTKAWASGVLTVRHGENTVTYRSQAELERAIDRTAAALGVASPIQAREPRSMVTYTRFRRG